MGVLTGAISVLFKALIDSKNGQIEDLKKSNLHNEETLTKDRDYYRTYVVSHIEEDKQTGEKPATQDHP